MSERLSGMEELLEVNGVRHHQSFSMSSINPHYDLNIPSSWTIFGELKLVGLAISRETPSILTITLTQGWWQVKSRRTRPQMAWLTKRNNLVGKSISRSQDMKTRWKLNVMLLIFSQLWFQLNITYIIYFQVKNYCSKKQCNIRNN